MSIVRLLLWYKCYNAVNLIDGMDGLAAGFVLLVTLLGLNVSQSEFFDIHLILFLLLLSYIIFNQRPAKIFMGDTGSLTIGAIIGIICVVTNSFFTTFIISGIFVIEAISVILQVSYFKITKKIFMQGKRLFLMTPIHHHFELQGIREEKIVEIFWLINIVLIIFSIVM